MSKQVKSITSWSILSFLMLVLSSCCDCDTKDDAETKSLLNIGFKADSIIKKKAAPLFEGHSQTHFGLDISHFQGDIIDKLSSSDDIRFVICKATQGDYFVDPDFRNNWNEIKEKGKIRGTYHFYDCSDDPIRQAEHFTSNAYDISSSDIAPILDIEQGSMSPNVSGQQMAKDILVFLKAVEQKVNRKPILYTDYAFAQKYLRDEAFATYDLWLAEYTNAKTPLVPTTWKEKGFKIWQKSASYTTHSTQTDFDVYLGNLNDLVH